MTDRVLNVDGTTIMWDVPVLTDHPTLANRPGIVLHDKKIRLAYCAYKSDLENKLQTYYKINGAIRRHFGKQMNKETKLRIHNVTAKAALKFGSEAWVLKKREEQHLEAAQMKFLRHLLGITKLDKEKNQCIRQKTGAQNTVKEIKYYQEKWLQHVQRMETNRLPKQALQYKPKDEET